MKKLFLSLFLVLAVLGVTSCGNDDEDDKFTPTAITSILNTAKNNDPVKVEGIVYGVVNNGFYVADSADGKVFVIMGSSWTPSVEFGDKVQITGQFSYVSNFPQIKSVSKLDVVNKGNTPAVTAASGSVTSIQATSATERVGSYGKIISLTATIGKNVANQYTLSDDEGKSILVNTYSNILFLEQKLNKRVNLNVILHSFTTENIWQVSFVGSLNDLVENPITFDSVVNKALDDINARVPKEIYGALVLPKVHSIHSYLTYAWEVVANDYVTINQDGSVTVNYDESDHNVMLKVTISNGTESRTVDYPIVSKGIVEQSVSDILTNGPVVDMSAVIISGIVVGIARNQSATIRSFILQDPETLETVSVDFSDTGSFILSSSDEFKSVKVGDEILVHAQYRLSGRPAVMNVRSLEVRSSGNEYEHDYENAYVLKDEASYQQFGENYEQYANKLVKFENPFLNFSTSGTPSDTNWVRLGYNEASGNTGFGQTGQSHYFAFLIAAQNESLGSDIWYKTFDIPFVAGPAKQVNGVFYAYALYVSDTYLAFVIPDWNCWQFSDKVIIEKDLALLIPSSIEEGTIELLTTHDLVTGNINWSSSNSDVIDPITGRVHTVSELMTVTLTATYTINGTEYTSEFKVTVLPKIELTVSQVLASAEDGQTVKVKGVIVAYASDGNNNNNRDGVVLMDNATGKMLLINGMALVHPEAAYGAYKDVSGNMLAIGDEIIVVGTYYLNTPAVGSGPTQTGRKHIQLSSGAEVTQVSTDNQLNYKYENAIVIDSDEDMQALADELKYGTLLKIVGTPDQPFYIGGSSSSAPFNMKIYFKQAVNDAGTRYNGKTFSLKSDVNIPNAGKNWWSTLFDVDGPFVGPSGLIPAIPIVGEMYVVIDALTSTYYQMSIIDVDSATVLRVIDKAEFETILAKLVPVSIEPGTIELPTTHRQVTGEITWTSSNTSVINLTTGTVAEVTKNTEVTLTATYTFQGEEYTYQHKITVMAPPPAEPLKVSELLVSGVDQAVLSVKGLVVAWQSDGNTSGLARGVLIMDPVTKETILVDGLELLGGVYGAYQASDQAPIEIGDLIVLNGVTYNLNSTVGKTDGRKSVLVSETSVVTIETRDNNITWNTSNAIVIASNEDMINFAKNPQFGVLIKFVSTSDNPFYFGGSSNTASSINYKFFYNKDAVDNDGTIYEGQTFSFKKTVNTPNAGDNWWSELFDLPNAFIGPTGSNPAIGRTGTIYAVLNYRTGTYFQMSLVNVTEIVANPLA